MGVEASRVDTDDVPFVSANGQWIRLGKRLISVGAIAWIKLTERDTLLIRMLDNSSNDNSNKVGPFRSYSSYGIDAFETTVLTSEQINALLDGLCGLARIDVPAVDVEKKAPT